MPQESAKTSVPRLPFLALPYLRSELPGWGRLFAVCRINDGKGDQWRNAGRRTIVGKWHGYRMDLDLSNWSERTTYFLGRFYDLDLQLLLNAALRPGDRMADVGANIGMITLHAASLVGPGGRVESFEPNPRCLQRLRQALEANRISQVRVHPMGLSDKNETLTLRVLTDHDGMGTFAEVQGKEAEMVSRTFEVPVGVGDEVLLKDAQDEKPLALVKIDVEGYEHHVLRGLRKTLEKYKPIVVAEVVSDNLKRAGTSRAQIDQFMRELGYGQPCALGTKRRVLRHHLRLRRIAEGAQEAARETDFVWMHPANEVSARLEPYLSNS